MIDDGDEACSGVAVAVAAAGAFLVGGCNSDKYEQPASAGSATEKRSVRRYRFMATNSAVAPPGLPVVPQCILRALNYAYIDSCYN